MLAGRSRASLDSLADELGGELETAVADVADPGSVRDLLGEGDVLLSTVGPFVRWGGAGDRGSDRRGLPVHRLDRRAGLHPPRFEEWGPRGEAAVRRS